MIHSRVQNCSGDAAKQKKMAAIKSPGDESMLFARLIWSFPERPKAIEADLVSHSLFYRYLAFIALYNCLEGTDGDAAKRIEFVTRHGAHVFDAVMRTEPE